MKISEILNLKISMTISIHTSTRTDLFLQDSPIANVNDWNKKIYKNHRTIWMELSLCHMIKIKIRFMRNSKRDIKKEFFFVRHFHPLKTIKPKPRSFFLANFFSKINNSCDQNDSKLLKCCLLPYLQTRSFYYDWTPFDLHGTRVMNALKNTIMSAWVLCNERAHVKFA